MKQQLALELSTWVVHKLLVLFQANTHGHSHFKPGQESLYEEALECLHTMYHTSSIRHCDYYSIFFLCYPIISFPVPKYSTHTTSVDESLKTSELYRPLPLSVVSSILRLLLKWKSCSLNPPPPPPQKISHIIVALTAGV